MGGRSHGTGGRARAARRAAALTLLALLPCAAAGLAASRGDARIAFAADAGVPPAVREFAWRVIETRCAYQRYERDQRSFWAFDTRATRVDAGVVYTIKILSELAWKRTEPPAVIEMTLVDDGRVRLTALTSTFVPCGG